MTRPAISVRNLGKQYSLASNPRTESFREALMSMLTAPFRGAAPPMESNETFWALRGLSFDVAPGEVVGVIGRNGAGKSTLLKVLSRITEPTAGEAVIYGRVASLLEVGTGFHGELSGRENIFLNGSILGMKRKEIRAKFDEIVAFAEMDRFIDTPVKRYSSGMYVRLAFAVAANLDPEVLIIDEVLAVGDISFQRKCLEKIKQVSRMGNAVLFVSHSMGTVRDLCDRVIVLREGCKEYDGNVKDGINRYAVDLTTEPGTAIDLRDWPHRKGTRKATIEQIRLEDADGVPRSHFGFGQPVRLVMRVNYPNKIPAPQVGFTVLTDMYEPLFATALSDSQPLRDQGPGVVEYSVLLEPTALMAGRYWLAAAVSRPAEEFYDWVDQVPGFVVTDEQQSREVAAHPRWGHFFFKHDWTARILPGQQ
jgi:lipopolysaccharide transport system ATP-binding protein